MEDDFIVVSPDDYDWSKFDIDAFKEWLHTEAPIYRKHAHFWIRAVEHRYAWTCGRAFSWESPERLVTGHFDLIGGPYCWISRKGVAYPCGFAGHDDMAEIIIGDRVDNVEKHYARVSRTITSYEDCYRYVDRPSNRMKEAVYDWLLTHRDQFSHVRDL